MLDLLPIWCCPLCGGALEIARRDELLRCTRCTTSYQIVGGIPDLRVARVSPTELEAERDAARRLARDAQARSLEELVRRAVELDDGGASPDQVDRRVDELLTAPARMSTPLRGWLRDAALTPGFVEIGCGTGALLGAAANLGVAGVGIDRSLRWLVVAKRLLEARGSRAVLCAALGEALPLRDESAPAVVSLGSVERVDDLPRFLREIDRIAAPSAAVAIATRNRFGLRAPPSAGLPSVAWLAEQDARGRRAERRTVTTRRVSVRRLRRLLRKQTHVGGRFVVAHTLDGDRQTSGARRALLLRAYERLAGVARLRWPLLLVGPSVQFIGAKAPGPAQRRTVPIPVATEVPRPIHRERDDRPLDRPSARRDDESSQEMRR